MQQSFGNNNCSLGLAFHILKNLLCQRTHAFSPCQKYRHFSDNHQASFPTRKNRYKSMSYLSPRESCFKGRKPVSIKPRQKSNEPHLASPTRTSYGLSGLQKSSLTQ